MGTLLPLGDALLVKVVAEDVDAVGAGQVVEHIAVEVGDGDAAGGLDEGRGAEMLAHQAAVLERHAVGFGELQVGDPLRHLGGQRAALGIAIRVEAGEAEEAVLPLHRDVLRCSVGAEEFVDVEFVVRHHARHHLGHLGMSGQRAVLGPRQREAGLNFGEGCGGAGKRGGGQRENRKGCFHDRSASLGT
ncbi:hypothetical protein ACVWY2_003744 [Bradyrhizobium sp. JR6.1]